MGNSGNGVWGRNRYSEAKHFPQRPIREPVPATVRVEGDELLNLSKPARRRHRAELRRQGTVLSARQQRIALKAAKARVRAANRRRLEADAA